MVHKALRKDREERFQTAGEMLQALRTLYIEMEKADASRDAYYEAMRALRRLVNTYGTGRYTKTRILI